MECLRKVGRKWASRKAAKEEKVEEDEAAKAIVDVAFRVHSTLGPGLLEAVYAVILAHELRDAGFEVARQVPIPIIYKGMKFEEGLRADLIVAQSVIVELSRPNA